MPFECYLRIAFALFQIKTNRHRVTHRQICVYLCRIPAMTCEQHKDVNVEAISRAMVI